MSPNAHCNGSVPNKSMGLSTASLSPSAFRIGDYWKNSTYCSILLRRTEGDDGRVLNYGWANTSRTGGVSYVSSRHKVPRRETDRIYRPNRSKRQVFTRGNLELRLWVPPGQHRTLHGRTCGVFLRSSSDRRHQLLLRTYPKRSTARNGLHDIPWTSSPNAAR